LRARVSGAVHAREDGSLRARVSGAVLSWRRARVSGAVLSRRAPMARRAAWPSGGVGRAGAVLSRRAPMARRAAWPSGGVGGCDALSRRALMARRAAWPSGGVGRRDALSRRAPMARWAAWPSGGVGGRDAPVVGGCAGSDGAPIPTSTRTLGSRHRHELTNSTPIRISLRARIQKNRDPRPNPQIKFRFPCSTMPRKKRIPVSPVLDIVAGDFAGHPSAPAPSKVREYMPFFL
jgi:hypothetical protein